MTFRRSMIFAAALAASACASTTASAATSQPFYVDVSIGKACWAAAYTNAGATWTMTVKDGNSVAAIFRGAGTNFAPMKVIKGSARFTVKSGITVTFQSGTGKADIKVVNYVIKSNSGDPAVFGTTFGGEDSSDDDWQDILANFTCLHHAG